MMTSCPACGEEIRLTDAEQASGHACCLLCEARFDTAVTRTGALLRAADVVEVVTSYVALPKRVWLVADDARRFDCRIELVGDTYTWSGFAPIFMSLRRYPRLSLVMLGLVAFMWMASRPKRIAIEDGVLIAGRKRIPVDQIDRLETEDRFTLVARHRNRSVKLVRGPEATIAWLSGKLGERLPHRN